MQDEVKIIAIAQDLGFEVRFIQVNDSNLAGYLAISPELKKDFGVDRIIAINRNVCACDITRIAIANLIVHYLIDNPDSVPNEYLHAYNPLNPAEETYNHHAIGLLINPNKVLQDLKRIPIMRYLDEIF